MRVSGGHRCKVKSALPTARCEQISRELLKTGLGRLATVSLKLKTIVGYRFKNGSRMRYVGLSRLHRCLEVTFDSGGFLIFCGARVTGFSSVLQHINERKESFVGGAAI
jgi:hypothetical protein